MQDCHSQASRLKSVVEVGLLLIKQPERNNATTEHILDLTSSASSNNRPSAPPASTLPAFTTVNLHADSEGDKVLCDAGRNDDNDDNGNGDSDNENNLPKNAMELGDSDKLGSGEVDNFCNRQAFHFCRTT